MTGPYVIRYYEATPDEYEEFTDEDIRCEYVDGVMIVHSPASPRHEELIIFLGTLLNSLVAPRQLGRVFGSNVIMQLGERRFCPDISFLADAHRDRLGASRITGPMDLVIEIVSKSTRDYDLGEKRAAYREGRVGEIWLADPELKQFEADVLAGDAYVTQRLTEGRWESRVLPGLSIDVTWLWSDPLPNPLECLE